MKKAERRQLNGLGMAARSTPEMLLQSPAPTTVSPEEGNCPARKGGSRGGNAPFIPVVSATGKPLMPCHPARARELINKGRAVRRFSKGIFYIKLLDSSDGDVQDIACGIDPGSKREGYTIKSEAHTFLNIQAEAVTWVSRAVEVRRNMRHARRFRKTPCRANRMNRTRGNLPPSTRARWGWKLRVAKWLANLYPISMFVVEDIKAITKGKRRWDASFSPLQIGKQWFYDELGKVAEVSTKQGWETKQMRDALGLKKSGKKMAEIFEAHAVDSWVLANSWVGGHTVPDNKNLMCIAPIRLHRRQLHALQPSKNNFRRNYGGTRSLGFKRGSLVSQFKHGLVYVGGTRENRISLHSLESGTILCRNAKPEDCQVYGFNTFKTRLYCQPRQVTNAAGSN